MNDLPAGWSWESLDALAQIQGGIQKQPTRVPAANAYPFLRVANVLAGGRLDLGDVHRIELFNGELERLRLQRGDLLVVEGNGSESQIGRAAMWDGSIPDCVHQNHLIRVRPGVRLIPEYLLLVWNSPEIRSKLVELSSSSSGLHTLSVRKLRGIKIPFPGVEEQRRIVDILEDHLSRLDAAGHGLKASQRRLVTLELAVLDRGYQGGPHVPLGDVTAIQGGIQKQQSRTPSDNPYPFLRVANVTSRGLNLGDVHSVQLFPGELERLRLEAGDLLVVEGNGSAGQIGRAALWDGSIDDCVHQNHLIRVRPKGGLLAGFLEAIWNSPVNREKLTSLASSSSGLYTLSVSKLKSLSIPLPDVTTQRDVIDRVVHVRQARQRLESEITTAQARAAQLRRSLLRAAFSGQLTATRNAQGIQDPVHV